MHWPQGRETSNKARMAGREGLLCGRATHGQGQTLQDLRQVKGSVCTRSNGKPLRHAVAGMTWSQSAEAPQDVQRRKVHRQASGGGCCHVSCQPIPAGGAEPSDRADGRGWGASQQREEHGKRVLGSLNAGWRGRLGEEAGKAGRGWRGGSGARGRAWTLPPEEVRLASRKVALDVTRRAV